MSRQSRPIDPAMLERILDVTRQLATPFDLKAMLAQVIDAGRAVLDAERGTVFLYDEARNELVSAVATGVDELRFPADRGIVGECAQKREIVNVPDAYADPRFDRGVDKKTGYRTRCLLTVPLIGHEAQLVGVLQLLNKHGGSFDTEDERVAAALAAQCAVALQRVQLTEQLVLKEKMQRELALAREIQVGFLPRKMPEIAGYDVAGLSRPADETGGDTFDLVPIDDHGLVLLLGDATGHGVGPALSVTQVRAMLRVAVRLGADLDDIFTHINNQLVADLADNRFVTAFLGVLDARDHVVRYHSAGQGPLLHFHAESGECEWLGASTMPLGFLERLVAKGPETRRLAPGDILGLITDGVFEYENTSGEAFGEPGVARLIESHHRRPMAELSETLLRAVREFGAGVPQADDITIVLVRRRES